MSAGCSPCCSPDLEASSLHDANLHMVFSAIALRALDIYRVDTPWLYQDTTPISCYGAYDDGEGSHQGPRPTSGHGKDGRGDLKEVILSLGVRGDGGIPRRMGLHDVNRSDTVDIPQAIEQRAALGLDGLHGLVADSKAYTPRPLGLCQERDGGLVTLVPRTCAIRQEGEKWGPAASVVAPVT